MSDIINLRLARKRKTRAAKEQVAEQNRARFGRTKLEKAESRKLAERESRLLDAHKRDRPDDGEEK
ncbi:DUF4169 family protein [Pseudaminobacter arsenicus]|uniref:DUF4169 family protein n=1 Tax=Borborobacter arsenicus TaxID=1851146 RepID=A0A432VCA8_9HYPH|nr:DUF4169 family protein [Pseudaminobacter arsenicus]RUM99754.1 DUF4169 family protein [Pseudaminobacter arsenicus]